jgi:ribose-phosphate pyrophosphokinase
MKSPADTEIKRVALIAGSAHPTLAFAIAAELGKALTPCRTDRFPDGELNVTLGEAVRGRETFLIQPLSPPVNDHLVELLALADACRRSAAARITAVVPYLGYARADKRHGRREAVMGRVVADALQTAGIDHLITVDVHTPQIEGFFRIPVETLTAVPQLAGALSALASPGSLIVAPDAGAVKLAARYATALDTEVAIVHKRRESGTKTQVTHVVGHVQNRDCIIVDDMISTGGTILRCVEALVKAGARTPILVAATHGLFVGSAREQIGAGPINRLIVTDSIPGAPADSLIHIVSIAPLVADAIRRTIEHRSFGDLFR